MSSGRIAWLTPADPPDAFPPVDSALVEPDGLLAAGGDLSVDRLIEAYTRGIFPWFDRGQPILWWAPDPRCVMRPEHYHCSRRFLRSLRTSDAILSFNRSFADVIAACAAPRSEQPGTWITPEMRTAYEKLHAEGWAHSVEVWSDGVLSGGLYGLAIGHMFFAESMFSGVTGGSKIALAGLTRVLREQGFPLIDCQVASRHLMTIGAELMPRQQFVAALRRNTADRSRFTDWPRAEMHAPDLLAPGETHIAKA